MTELFLSVTAKKSASLRSNSLRYSFYFGIVLVGSLLSNLICSLFLVCLLDEPRVEYLSHARATS